MTNYAIAVLFLAFSQLGLLILYIKIIKSISDLRHESHHHTFFYNKEGEKVHEFISVHKHGGYINE
jgi:hypothetical protein